MNVCWVQRRRAVMMSELDKQLRGKLGCPTFWRTSPNMLKGYERRSGLEIHVLRTAQFRSQHMHERDRLSYRAGGMLYMAAATSIFTRLSTGEDTSASVLLSILRRATLPQLPVSVSS